MSRTFAESVIDPLLIIFEILEKDVKVGKISLLIGTLISTLIIIFCCCVYNEVIILYCYNMEYYTYSEISERARSNTEFKMRYLSINEDEIDLDNKTERELIENESEN